MKWNLLLLLLSVALLCSGASIGQLDTFEDGTLQGWTVALGPGSGVPDPSWAPMNVTGGPGGADDNYMLIRSLGMPGPGGRLTVMNVTTWTGDYLGLGINAIQMSVRNEGQTDLFLRLVFETLGAMGPTDVAVSTAAINLPVGGDWTSVLFPVTEQSLTPVVGSVSTLLGNVNVLRIMHGSSATFPPEPIAAALGVDNIGALSVPEPATMLLTGAVLIWFAGRRRTRQ